jgi:hypothetical protein
VRTKVVVHVRLNLRNTNNNDARQNECHVKHELRQRSISTTEAPPVASQGRQFTERAENEINFNWIRAALQYATVLLKDVAVLLAILYFLGVVAICVAILFYTFCR